MKSLFTSLSPWSSDRGHSEENDSMTEDKKEKYKEKVKLRKKDEDTPQKKQKKRLAGDRSGRQLALWRIGREEKKNLWKTFGPHVPSFGEAAKASREVLLEFAEDSDIITEKHAFALRVYMNKKFELFYNGELWTFCHFPVHAFFLLPLLKTCLHRRR